jgi:hypothetical protein
MLPNRRVAPRVRCSRLYGISRLLVNHMLAKRKWAGPLSILAAGCIAAPTSAIEVTEPQGAAHGYPGLCDINGKKLADGEFRQWAEDRQLHVVITYKFNNGQLFEEKALFRQHPELKQEQWSWTEHKNGKLFREFTADFLAKTAKAHIRENDETKEESGEIEVEPGRTFAGFGFSLALANLRKRLLAGEQVELKAVGFTPKPKVVTVKISHGGLDKMKMSGRFLRGDRFIIHPEIPAIAKLFVHVPDTKIWLTNPRPAGFLRWEGPTVLPSDRLIRVDLVSDHASGPAEAVEANSDS